ncbi:unnamed protein product [Parnassius mnemosyne]|uniref:Uncharacterized protein n=1 Tax=Parnassius mnemosyne TaxID=213953 RepID=A0AAV1KM25_9NEOP
MACQTKRSDTVVVHEFLAFVQQKLDVMDQVSLEQILMTSFTEDEINHAKKLLANSAVIQIRLITRHRDGRGKKDLQDIFRLFNETDPDDIETFVARDLNKLPPITFDHVRIDVLSATAYAVRLNSWNDDESSPLSYRAERSDDAPAQKSISGRSIGGPAAATRRLRAGSSAGRRAQPLAGRCVSRAPAAALPAAARPPAARRRPPIATAHRRWSPLLAAGRRHAAAAPPPSRAGARAARRRLAAAR